MRGSKTEPGGVAHRVVLVEAVLTVDDLAGDDDGRIGVGQGDVVDDHREVTVGERRHAGGADEHALARRGAPFDVAGEHTGAEVEGALVAEHVGLGEHERLVVDVDTEDLGVGCVDDRLADPREAEGLLGVADRPRLVEAR